MIRGTFANPRIRNRLAPGTEGGVTLHLPDGDAATIYDAAVRYAAEGVPLVVIAGKEYRSEEHTSELQSLMRISYAVFCFKKNNNTRHSRYVNVNKTT